jgi:hypothetical protein
MKVVPKRLRVNDYFENILRLMNTGSTGSSAQDAPLAKVAFCRSEQRLRVQKTPARIAPILLVVVHLATPAGIHSLDDLVLGNARLTAGNCNSFFNNRPSESLG